MGVVAINSRDPKFESHLKPFIDNPRSRTGNLDEIRPYALIIKNESKSSIAMFAIRYERSYADRPSNVEDIVMKTRDAEGKGAFRPGESYLVFPGVQGVHPGVALGILNPVAVSRNMQWFRAAQRVDVILDSVFFDSGLVVGPDRRGTLVQYEAERRGMRQLVSDLRGFRSAGAELETVRAYLRCVGSA